MFDYLIVGAGFAGSVLAERLAAGSNKKVLICDKRPHIGGNAYDHYNDAGILVHKYGPHIFHTNSREVFEYFRVLPSGVRTSIAFARVSTGRSFRFRSTSTRSTLFTDLSLTSFEVEEFFKKVAEPIGADSHVGRRRGQQGGTRAVRKILSQLHAQTVGTRSI